MWPLYSKAVHDDFFRCLCFYFYLIFLYFLLSFDFCLTLYIGGLFRYFPALLKMVRLNIFFCNQDSLWKHVNCYSGDVILTYKCLVSHWPSFLAVDIVEVFSHAQPMFLTLKAKLKNSSSMWFLKMPLDKSTFCQTVKTLVESTFGIMLRGQTFTNKTLRRIGITRMKEGLILVKKGMRIMDHRALYWKEGYVYNGPQGWKIVQKIQCVLIGFQSMDNARFDFGRVIT